MKKYWNCPAGTYQVFLRDMLDQPHLLIAGSTGSGKSVLLNALMHTATLDAPSEKQFILLDPKRVELQDYALLPHTLRYANNMDAILSALEYACDLMDYRYSQMEKQRLKMWNGSHVYVVCDEYVDCKMRIGKAAEKLLIRLSSEGRAAGVHVILCTQRPTRDIINGAIRANFAARVALRTDSKQESRNIIDTDICYDLPLFGYAYYKHPQSRDPVLLKINMIPQTDINERVRHWINQMPRRKRKIARH